MPKDNSDKGQVVESFKLGSESEIPELEPEFDTDDPDYDEKYVTPAIVAEPQAGAEEVDPSGEKEEDLSPTEKNRRELQSRADRAEQELERLRTESEKMRADYESIKPLVDLIDTNEDARSGILEVINSVQGGQATAKQSAGNAQLEPSLEKPEEPVKPASYDRYEALNDPSSESAKYDSAKENYVIQMANYSVAIQESMVAKAEAERQAEQAALAEKQAEAQLERQWVSDLMAKHGASQAEAEAIVKLGRDMDISDYQAMFVNDYRRRTKGSAEEVLKANRRDELKQQAEARKAPVSGAAVVGGGEQMETSKESFMERKPVRNLVALK